MLKPFQVRNKVGEFQHLPRMKVYIGVILAYCMLKGRMNPMDTILDHPSDPIPFAYTHVRVQQFQKHHEVVQNKQTSSFNEWSSLPSGWKTKTS